MRWTFITAVFLALSWLTFAGVAAADDTGAGACAMGVGASVNDPTGDGPYVGVNVGMNSPNEVHFAEQPFMAACCAETGERPDCFRPVE